MRLIIDLATSRKDGKLHFDSKLLTWGNDFKALTDNEQIALIAMLANDLGDLAKKATNIQTKKAGSN